MYFCYIDESGDGGAYEVGKEKTGSPYFVLVGLVIHIGRWKVALDTLKSFRKKIAREAYLPYDVEFHCAELIDPRKIKEYTQISIPDRWKLINEYATTIGQQTAFKIIGVVIDKAKSKLAPEQYSTEAITKLYQAYDEFLKSESANGLVFIDRTNEKHINTHVRKLLGTGASGETIPDVRIGWIIEDPIFRSSKDSMFIQSTDVVAYTLKEMEFPQTSRKKFNADRIFSRRLSAVCFHSKISDNDGIIRA